MYHISEFNKNFYKPKEVAEYYGVVSRTISKYCQNGRIKATLLDTGRRVISKEELIRILDERKLINYEPRKKQDVIYARVSTHKQKNRGDLERQINTCLSYAATKNPKDLKVFKEVGSGLNDNRKELLKLIKKVLGGEIDRIFITYKDRLTRFGFNYLKTICDYNKTNIVIISDEEKDKTLEQELAEDMISIIHSFSGNLYGMRKKVKKEINKVLGDEK